MTIRFDEFVERYGVAAASIDQFDGFVVEVGVPPGWEPFDSAVGIRVWVCRNDPRIEEFCANAVLTMHRVAVGIEASEIFAMLVEQQLQSVPGCDEVGRELADATEGAGVVGRLELQITRELGAISSVSQSRIITINQQTLIAQLTATALRDSPVEPDHVWLTVRSGSVGPSASITTHDGVTAARMRDGH